MDEKTQFAAWLETIAAWGNLGFLLSLGLLLIGCSVLGCLAAIFIMYG